MRESVHPHCIAAFKKRASCCFCGRMPPKWGPCGAASGRRKSPKGGAQDARQFAACTRMCIQRTPEPAREPGGQDARKARYLGCVSFGDFSLHKQRKVTRSPVGRVEALHFKRDIKSKELDSGFRRNDEQKYRAKDKSSEGIKSARGSRTRPPATLRRPARNSPARARVRRSLPRR